VVSGVGVKGEAKHEREEKRNVFEEEGKLRGSPSIKIREGIVENKPSSREQENGESNNIRTKAFLSTLNNKVSPQNSKRGGSGAISIR